MIFQLSTFHSCVATFQPLLHFSVEFDTLLHGMCFLSGFCWLRIAADEKASEQRIFRDINNVIAPKRFRSPFWFDWRVRNIHCSLQWISTHCWHYKSVSLPVVTKHRLCLLSNATGVISVAGVAYLSGAPEQTLVL